MNDKELREILGLILRGILHLRNAQRDIGDDGNMYKDWLKDYNKFLRKLNKGEKDERHSK